MKITKSLKLTLRKLLQVSLGEIKADNGTLIFEGDEIAVGIEVFVEGEDGELIPAPDAEYLAEDGRKIIVKDGIVSEIVEAEKKEEAPEEITEEKAEEKSEPEVELAEEIAEPAAEPATEDEAKEEELTIEERVAKIEARNEEIIAGIEKILNSFASFEERLGAIEAKVAGLEEPAAEPAAEPEVEEEKQSKISYLRKQK